MTNRGGPLADFQIRERMALPEADQRRLVIRPFADTTKEPGRVSHGLTSYGYDLRLGRRFKVFDDTAAVVVDPLDFDASRFRDHEGDSCLVPPNSFVLGESLEWFEVPEDVIALVCGKSSYARCGIGAPLTPLEPGWRGIVTIEVANHTRLPARIHAGQGFAQVVFFEGAAPCEQPYGKKPGSSYQNQLGITLPRA